MDLTLPMYSAHYASSSTNAHCCDPGKRNVVNVATYDNGYAPPDWWLERLAAVMAEQGWDDSDVIKVAREIDGRERRWGPDRISKMRGRKQKGTIQMVVAISRAAKIPSPIIEAVDEKDAEAIDRWIATRRPTTNDAPPRKHAVIQALDNVVKDAKDQTSHVPSVDEGISRGSRTRRTPGSR